MGGGIDMRGSTLCPQVPDDTCTGTSTGRDCTRVVNECRTGAREVPSKCGWRPSRTGPFIRVRQYGMTHQAGPGQEQALHDQHAGAELVRLEPRRRGEAEQRNHRLGEHVECVARDLACVDQFDPRAVRQQQPHERVEGANGAAGHGGEVAGAEQLVAGAEQQGKQRDQLHGLAAFGRVCGRGRGQVWMCVG